MKYNAHLQGVIIDKNTKTTTNWTTSLAAELQPPFLDSTNGFPANYRQRNERKNSILMT